MRMEGDGQRKEDGGHREGDAGDIGAGVPNAAVGGRNGDRDGGPPAARWTVWPSRRRTKTSEERRSYR